MGYSRSTRVAVGLDPVGPGRGPRSIGAAGCVWGGAESRIGSDSGCALKVRIRRSMRPRMADFLRLGWQPYPPDSPASLTLMADRQDDHVVFGQCIQCDEARIAERYGQLAQSGCGRVLVDDRTSDQRMLLQCRQACGDGVGGAARGKGVFTLKEGTTALESANRSRR
jgi:hypothetical protein